MAYLLVLDPEAAKLRVPANFRGRRRGRRVRLRRSGEGRIIVPIRAVGNTV